MIRSIMLRMIRTILATLLVEAMMTRSCHGWAFSSSSSSAFSCTSTSKTPGVVGPRSAVTPKSKSALLPLWFPAHVASRDFATCAASIGTKQRPRGWSALRMAVLDVDEQDNNNNEGPSKKDNSPPPEEMLGDAQFESKVDWDAEWKKVKKQQTDGGQGVERPGKNFYKSEAEIAAIRAANRASAKLQRKQSSFQAALPSFDSLKGDWKFWVGVLLAVSFGTSLLTAVSGPGQMDPPASISTQDSYFI